MTAQLNKELFEELCKNFRAGQMLFHEFIERIKLLTIPLKQWNTLEFLSIYWSQILKSKSEMHHILISSKTKISNFVTFSKRHYVPIGLARY